MADVTAHDYRVHGVVELLEPGPCEYGQEEQHQLPADRAAGEILGICFNTRFFHTVIIIQDERMSNIE